MPLARLVFPVLIFLFGIPAAAVCNDSFRTAADSLSDTDTVIVDQLLITGNKITRLSVISREMVLHEHDTLSYYVFRRAAERTRENLMNTGLFNFVNITHQLTGNRKLIVIVDISERWYIFPVPIFELVDRNFNEWIRSGDASRVNYGFYLNWDNFRGMNESMRLQFKWGYSQRIGISYNIPFINKNQEEGLQFNLTFARNREVGYKVRESKLLRYKDDGFVRKDVSAGFRYTQRAGFYNYNSFTAEYRYNQINDSVSVLNPEYLGQGVKVQEQILIAWQFRRDRRDFKVYPLKGYLFDFDAVKNGIGLLQNEPDLLYLQTQVKYYTPLAPRWYVATSVKGKLSGQSESSYFNQRGFGFGNDFIRGYEYYVIPGQNYFLSRNSVKFALLPTRVIVLPFSILEKFRTIPYAFYLNANFDAGFVRDRQFKHDNPLANKWQYGYGLGIDYVTYYSLVFRVEYSINKFGEKGFFLHFTAPI